MSTNHTTNVPDTNPADSTKTNNNNSMSPTEAVKTLAETHPLFLELDNMMDSPAKIPQNGK